MVFDGIQQASGGFESHVIAENTVSNCKSPETKELEAKCSLAISNWNFLLTCISFSSVFIII